MKTTFTLFISLVLFFGVSTAFAQGIYMELIPATPGLPTVTGEIKITSFQGAVENLATVGSATGGAGGGRIEFGPVEITKQVDLSSSSFQAAITRGAHYKAIRFNFRNAAGQLVYRIAIGTAFVTKYATSAAEICPTGCIGINETFTIAYGEIAYLDYTQLNSQGAPRTITWNQMKNVSGVDDSLTGN